MSTKSLNGLTTEQNMVSVLQELKDSGRTSVERAEVTKLVGEVTGFKKDSVTGTLWNTGSGSAFLNDWYIKNCLDHKQENGRVTIKFDYDPDRKVHSKFDFDTPQKREHSELIASYIPEEGCPLYLGLPCTHGFDVQAVVNRNPNTEVVTVECEEAVQEVWKVNKVKMGIESEDHLTTVEEFVTTPDFTNRYWDVIYLDIMGYPCDPLFNLLQNLDTHNNYGVMLLNTHSGKGRSKKWNSRFRNASDPSLSFMRAAAPSVPVERLTVYSQGTHRKGMQTFIWRNK